LNVFTFILIAAVFYWMTYYSVSSFFPTSIPVHHDDYANYSLAASRFEWSWIRPLSTGLVYFLSALGPDWLIWTVRVCTVTYAYLCWKILVELVNPRTYWITLFFFVMAALSTPIIAEYARYTGMITHMMSGCFGLAAVYFLFKDDRVESDNWLYVSVALLLLSTLAKEDFVLFYIFSAAYILFKSDKPTRKRLLVGLIGLTMSLFMVAGAKFLAVSSFLGASDAQSSYYIDTSPSGVINTVWRYLTGAGHPAMINHGKIIAGAMVFSAIAALILLVRDRTLPKTLYVVGAALTLIAPYSVLPNHVNAYYELIWLPFVIGSVYVALAELMRVDQGSVLRSAIPALFLAALATQLYMVDTPGRLSVAGWYDAAGTDNAKVLNYLEHNKADINAAPSVCIYGASALSPWYIHNSQYLATVMGLHTVWNIFINKNSPLYAGMQQGADSSAGRVVVRDISEFNADCLKLKVGNSE
jgi:hypothetical protein